MALSNAECIPPITATCIGQNSSSKAADGTITNVQNNCFSDGTKDLEVDTYAPGSSTPTRTIQILRNGAPCSTFQETTSSGVDAAGNRTDTQMQVLDDGTGNLLATILTVTTQTSGGSEQTKTVTCLGQPPEPLDPACFQTRVFNCATGTCSQASP